MTVASDLSLTEEANLKQKQHGKNLDRFLKNIGLGLVISGAIAAAGFFFTPYAPNAPDFLNRLSPPSSEHWFGTDQLGRDVATRLLYGGVWSVGLAFLITLIGAITGTLVGLAAGHFGRFADITLMRMTDSFFAFPELVAAVTIAGVLGPSTANMVLALILVGWMKFARLVRGLSIDLAHRDFITQAKLNDLPSWLILWRHILPNIGASLLVLWTNSWSRSILSISGLSFLGFGVQPPNAEWGAMLLSGKAYLQTAPHLMIFPGLAILVTVLTINLMGDQLRDLVDSRSTISE
ncbi:ABC transporter permease subunit [Labrenzia sp. OB1]|uniref:ABC transporter permease n=1 Tax=Labrenzia sp. OB1 TaxID=1561204 RepID=UPI0007B2B0D7|nr:ABC transporter permease subunit [Labrenzia sp. OB1]KZM49301.1 sodium:proton antiporter [Labrenzia sp. OB1]